MTIFRSLNSKLSITLLLLFSILSLVSLSAVVVVSELYQQEVTSKLHKGLAAHIVKQKEIIANEKINQDALKELFHMLMVINPSIELYLLDTQGKILSYSAPPGKVKKQYLDLKVIRQSLNQDSSMPQLGEDPRDKDRKKVFSAAEIRQDGKLQGYLYIILSSEIYSSAVQKITNSYIMKWAIGFLILIVVATVFMGLFIFYTITGRLRRLSSAMDEFTRTQGIQPVNKKNLGDELERLNENFYHMAGRLQKKVADLKEVDSLRRELVANVSHDLRTPLATLQGYIETLQLKEDVLSMQDRQEYLSIALDHCHRLNKLVAELFELAKLDSKDTRLRIEPFCITELVYDVTQKFKLALQEKDLRVLIEGDDTKFVNADLALIERVIENLFENALRHSQTGGTISIKLKESAQDIEVTVADDGEGIPHDELPKIFDRFYQVEKSRNGQGGAGLGLAISKKILELHERSIKAVSQPNRGTSFIFNLPAGAHG